MIDLSKRVTQAAVAHVSDQLSGEPQAFYDERTRVWWIPEAGTC